MTLSLKHPNLITLSLPYFSFDADEKQGGLVVHPAIAPAVTRVFRRLFEEKFPIFSMAPIDHFGNSDDQSMAANNTVAYNAREIVGGGKASLHSYGLAFDINPRQNPYLKNGLLLPPDGRYDPTAKGTLTPEIAAWIKAEGFVWGGDWTSLKDYMHFSWRELEPILPGRAPEI
jgi:hypothetical protein